MCIACSFSLPHNSLLCRLFAFIFSTSWVCVVRHWWESRTTKKSVPWNNWIGWCLKWYYVKINIILMCQHDCCQIISHSQSMRISFVRRNFFLKNWNMRNTYKCYLFAGNDWANVESKVDMMEIIVQDKIKRHLDFVMANEN